MRTYAAWLKRGLVVAAVAIASVRVGAQGAATPGTVRIPAGVTADGQALPAGAYSLRLSSDPVSPVVGQSPDSARWVEFLQAGQVKGRELAVVVAPADVKLVAKGAPPAAGKPAVQLISGATYVRVWFDQAGTQYLVYLVRTK